jgi:nucleoside-diphosphate-sugar epimerase
MFSKEDYGSFYSKKHVVVTGGAGFVGSNLAHALHASGAHVTVVDNFHPDYGANKKNLEGLLGSERFHLIEGDICDRDLMKKTISDNELVFHAAAQCSHVDSMIDPWLDVRFNIEGTLSLLEASKNRFKSTGRLTSFVYVSTRAVVGAPLENPATERTLPNPADVYGVNKMAAEYYGAVYARVHKIPWVSLRLTNSFGPRHQMRHGKYGILNWFLSLILRNQPIKIFGDGKQLRDYLYIDDAVEALMSCGLYTDALKSGTASSGIHRMCGDHIPYAVFNAASGTPRPFVECAKNIIKLAERGELQLVPWPSDRKAIETGDFIADCNQIHNILGWHPKVDFDTGLKKTISFYKENLQHYL